MVDHYELSGDVERGESYFEGEHKERRRIDDDTLKKTARNNDNILWKNNPFQVQ